MRNMKNNFNFHFAKLKRTLCIILLILLSGCGMRNKLIFFPDNYSEIPEQDIPDYITEKRIQTTDGQNIQAYLFRHNDSLKHSLIIYFHGNAGNLYHRFDYAKKLYDMNQDVLLISYRGYAKSTGKPTEKGIYIDGESSIIYAIDSLGYVNKNITIIGRSLGTTVAIHISRHRVFNAVVLITPLTSGKAMTGAMGLNFLKFIAGNSYNSLEKINDLNSKILIIHGNKDEIIPYNMGKKLFDAYRGTKQMVTIKKGRHNDLQDIDPQLFWGEIEKFVNEN